MADRHQMDQRVKLVSSRLERQSRLLSPHSDLSSTEIAYAILDLAHEASQRKDVEQLDWLESACISFGSEASPGSPVPFLDMSEFVGLLVEGAQAGETIAEMPELQAYGADLREQLESVDQVAP